MKNINDFINEQRSGKNSKPKTKKELLAIIEERISKEGEKCDLNDIDVSGITDMSGLFADTSFDGDISGWDVSNVTDMAGMFGSASFNGDISGWDVSNVTDMSGMFDNSLFNGDISGWDVGNVNEWGAFCVGSPLNRKKSKQPKF